MRGAVRGGSLTGQFRLNPRPLRGRELHRLIEIEPITEFERPAVCRKRLIAAAEAVVQIGERDLVREGLGTQRQRGLSGFGGQDQVTRIVQSVGRNEVDVAAEPVRGRAEDPARVLEHDEAFAERPLGEVSPTEP